MTIQRFAMAGLVSSAITGMATIVPGALVFVAPVAFAAALAVARRSSVGTSVLFIVANTLALFATLVIGAVSVRLQNVPPSGLWPCVVILITGPVLFVLAYCLSFRPYASEVHFVLVTPAAVVFALIGFGVGGGIAVAILKLPKSMGFTLGMAIWQTGVAIAIGLSERTSSFMSEEDECREQTRLPNHNLIQSKHEIAGSPSTERIEP